PPPFLYDPATTDIYSVRIWSAGSVFYTTQRGYFVVGTRGLIPLKKKTVWLPQRCPFNYQ
ncbi:hypothetical protein ACVGXP_01940, partial [Enterobacter hormaechei]